MNLPESKLTKNQKGILTIYFDNKRMDVIIRYDDERNNGHNTFSITADIYIKNRHGKFVWDSGRCQHEKIKEVFPGFDKYIKWHLCSSDGPLCYLANTLYSAGDKDCFGGRKGEVRWWKYNVSISPSEHGIARRFVFNPDEPHKLLDKKEAEEMAVRLDGEIVPVPWVYFEGKDRELDTARRSAIWPDATDEELMSDNLKDKLLERLPALMEEFKRDMEELGFEY